MRYLMLFENFENKEIVTVDGEIGQVLGEKDGNIIVKFFRPSRTELIDPNDVKKQIKCLSQCDKKIVGVGNKRKIECSYCGKEQSTRKK